jgi:hypothetical protein
VAGSIDRRIEALEKLYGSGVGWEPGLPPCEECGFRRHKERSANGRGLECFKPLERPPTH